MIVDVRVKPGSKKGPMVQPGIDGSLLVYVRELPKEGEANRAITGLLADYYGVPKNNVQMISGQKSKQKRFLVNPK